MHVSPVQSHTKIFGVPSQAFPCTLPFLGLFAEFAIIAGTVGTRCVRTFNGDSFLQFHWTDGSGCGPFRDVMDARYVSGYECSSSVFPSLLAIGSGTTIFSMVHGTEALYVDEDFRVTPPILCCLPANCAE